MSFLSKALLLVDDTRQGQANAQHYKTKRIPISPFAASLAGEQPLDQFHKETTHHKCQSQH